MDYAEYIDNIRVSYGKYTTNLKMSNKNESKLNQNLET